MEKKICALCKKEIGKKDNYVRVTDYTEGDFDTESFYHRKCFKDRIAGKDNPDRMMTRALLKRTLPLLKKVEEITA